MDVDLKMENGAMSSSQHNQTQPTSSQQFSDGIAGSVGWLNGANFLNTLRNQGLNQNDYLFRRTPTIRHRLANGYELVFDGKLLDELTIGVEFLIKKEVYDIIDWYFKVLAGGNNQAIRQRGFEFSDCIKSGYIFFSNYTFGRSITLPPYLAASNKGVIIKMGYRTLGTSYPAVNVGARFPAQGETVPFCFLLRLILERVFYGHQIYLGVCACGTDHRLLYRFDWYENESEEEGFNASIDFMRPTVEKWLKALQGLREMHLKVASHFNARV